jgi:hypothetical protein
VSECDFETSTVRSPRPKRGGAGDVINHSRALKLSQIVEEFLEFYVKLITCNPCKILAACCYVYDVTIEFGVYNLLSKQFLCTLPATDLVENTLPS